MVQLPIRRGMETFIFNRRFNTGDDSKKRNFSPIHFPISHVAIVDMSRRAISRIVNA